MVDVMGEAEHGIYCEGVGVGSELRGGYENECTYDADHAFSDNFL